jgi:Mn-dependent DtxR family transcriptional regulator
VDQRLARWLLTMSDYAGPSEFLMNHESIAAMLGVRRVSVTDGARKLQADTLISYRRGHIRVLDKSRLGKQCCECYRVIRQEYKSLYSALPRLLAGK